MAVVDHAVAVGPDGFQRELVLKRIRPRFSRDERFARMFVDEARIASQLNHPNIVQIFEFGKIDGDYFLAMEHVPGVDLARLGSQLVDSGDRFPIALAAFITIEVCRALDYAHRKRGPDGTPLGIVHRDVSPANVLISREGAVKLADFGIARAAERREQTLDGVVKGKVAFMSPEQVRDLPLDGRTDIFSAGIILYLILAGEHPFAGVNDGESIGNLLTSEWPPPSEIADDIPPALDRIVMQATAKDRDERYETAARLAEDLEQFLFDSRLRASASELSSLMKRIYGDDAATAPIPRIAIDDVVASEIRRMAGPGDELPHYTALIEPRSARCDDAPRSGTQPMFRVPPLPAPAPAPAPAPVPAPEHVTEPLLAGRWEKPAGVEAPPVPEAPLEPPRRRASWPVVVLIGIVSAGLVAGIVVAWHGSMGGGDPAVADQRASSGASDVASTAAAAHAHDAVIAPTQDEPPATLPDVGPAAAPPPRAPDAGVTVPVPHRPPAAGWLRVVTRPHYAEVFIDGRRRGTTPLLVQVAAGRRRVRLVNAQLGRSEQRTVVVEPGHGRDAPASVLVEEF